MENVRIAILSADDTVCAFLDNAVDKCMPYWDEVLHTYLQGSQYTFELRTLADHDDAQFIVEGNHCSFRYKNHDYYCTIVHVEKSEHEIYMQAYGLTLELTNETVDSFSGTSLSIVQYIQHYQFENTFVIGVNEVSDKRISHEWTGQETILARLFSTANVFDAELEFITELNDDYSLKQITLNLYRKHSDDYQGIGEDKSGTIIRYGQGIEGITKTSDITELYTAIRPTGTDGLTLTGLGEKKEYDADGNLEFWHEANGRDIRAMQSRERFPSLAMGADNDRWIAYMWTMETDNVNMLYGRALAELRKNCVPKNSYDVQGYIDGNIGDTYTIEDAEFKPVLYLQARIVEQQICFTDRTKCSTVLDNFTEIESQISGDLLTQMQEMINANKTYQLVVSSSNGLILPEGVDHTVLTAYVRDKSQDVTGNFTVNWYKNSALVYTGTSLSVSRESLNPSAVYRIVAVDANGQTRAMTEITLAAVTDGTSITITNQVITYQVSESGTAIPTGEWLTEIPEVQPGEYLWVRTVITYSDGTSVTQHSVSRNGVDGSDGQDGTSVTIISTSVVYQAHTSGIVAPTGQWSESPPNITPGMYLWTRTTVVYSDGKETVSYSVSRSGLDGSDGTSITITSTSVTYQVSTSGTTVPSGTWSSSIPTVSAGQYLWTRTIVNYSDGKSTTSYSVSRFGVDGADADQPLRLIIESSAGQIFKNSGIATTLRARVYQGNDELTQAEFEKYGAVKWYRNSETSAISLGATKVISEGSEESTVIYRAQLEGAEVPAGRNLLLNTNQGKTGWWWNTNSGTVSITDEVEKGVNITNFAKTGDPGMWNAVQYRGGIAFSEIKPGTAYTLSFYLRDNLRDLNKSLNVFIMQSNGANGMTKNPKPLIVQAKKGDWLYAQTTLYTNDTLPTQIGSQQLYFSGFGDTDVSYSIKDLKLESGIEATPWTPAPEDGIDLPTKILAFDVITLATVTDVQGIYRFYQLATSMPTKPATYPPASPWMDEMPGYQLGNQDSLYFVDVTVFNDLTYQYGEVQLSTDYEAVKATYADALQQIANAEKQMQSEIQKTNESIRAEVSEDYYKKDQTDDLLGTISTALEQTKDSFTMQFNSFQADLNSVNADNSAKFQELYQYISFKGGSIELGETGNTITLTIENDRISFKQAGQEIAYMSNNQLYITDANIVTSLRIGNFIFSPRPNGSLDFKKVGA